MSVQVSTSQRCRHHLLPEGRDFISGAHGALPALLPKA